MKYRKVYDYRVVDEMKNGVTVFCVDKEAKEVYNLAGRSASVLFHILNECDNGSERYEFFAEEGDE